MVQKHVSPYKFVWENFKFQLYVVSSNLEKVSRLGAILGRETSSFEWFSSISHVVDVRFFLGTGGPEGPLGEVIKILIMVHNIPPNFTYDIPFESSQCAESNENGFCIELRSFEVGIPWKKCSSYLPV